MTVSAQVKQTMASLKGAKDTLEAFAKIEENIEAKETLSTSARKIEKVIEDMERRIGVLEFEEPQYKGF